MTNTNMMQGCSVHKISWWLMVIGALNWGIVGLLNQNVVEIIFGGWPLVVRIIYILVGLAALAVLFGGSCKACKK